jgi:hypothetical protein
MLNPFARNSGANDAQTAIDLKFRREKVARELVDTPFVLELFTKKRKEAEERRRQLLAQLRASAERSSRDLADLEPRIVAARKALDAAEAALPRLRREYHDLSAKAEGLRAGVESGCGAGGGVIIREVKALADARINVTIDWLQRLLANARVAVEMWMETETVIVKPKGMYDAGGTMERRGLASNVSEIEQVCATLTKLLAETSDMLVADYGDDPIEALRQIETAALAAIKQLAGGESPILALGDALAA